jgi:hypothetical protein
VPEGYDIRITIRVDDVHLSLGDDPPLPVLAGVDLVAAAGGAAAGAAPAAAVPAAALAAEALSNPRVLTRLSLVLAEVLDMVAEVSAKASGRRRGGWKMLASSMQRGI